MLSKIKSFVKSLFATEVKPNPVAEQLGGLVDALERGGYDSASPKPKITKAESLAQIKKYEGDLAEFKKLTAPTQRHAIASEIEYYERHQGLKKELLVGIDKIEGFIARAKRDEVRLVRQLR